VKNPLIRAFLVEVAVGLGIKETMTFELEGRKR
jgi:hypothetical protein